MDIDLNDAEYWANVCAQELEVALTSLGVRLTMPVVADDEGDVMIHLLELSDAETLMSFGVDSTGGPGSMYDRSTMGCVSVRALDEDDPEADEKMERAMRSGWTWDIHPSMYGRRMDWHIRLLMPVADASQLAANINTVVRGGAL